MRLVMVSCVLILTVLLLAAKLTPEINSKGHTISTCRNRLQEKLATRVTMPPVQPGIPLREIFDRFSAEYNVTILVDTRAFQVDLQIHEPESQPVSLPALKDVSLREVLNLAASQAEGECVQRGNLLVCVPMGRARQVALGQSVDVICRERPLNLVLADLEGLSGYNIVLDTYRVGTVGQRPLTIQVHDVSLRTAVNLVASLGGLQVVEFERTLLVTTLAHAHLLRSARMPHWNEYFVPVR